MEAPALTAITDLGVASLEEHQLAYAALAAQLGSRFAVQLRWPGAPARELLRFGEKLLGLLVPHGSHLIVNDRLDIARALGLHHVHLRNDSVSVSDARAMFAREQAWLSVTCHHQKDFSDPRRAGADAWLVSPVYESPNKGTPLGLAGLQHLLATAPTGTTLLALGGVTSENVAELAHAGARGVAMIRGALDRSRAEELVQAVRGAFLALPKPS